MADLPSRGSGRGTQWAIVAVLGGLLAVVAVTGYFYAQSVRLDEEKALAESDAIARGIAAFIEAREENFQKILEAYAGRFRFREVIRRRDRAEALIHLRQIAESFPDLDRPFLADPAGVLWAVYPEAPEIYGTSFAQRDWYRGISRDWRPYVSEIFVGAASRVPVIVLVVPVRDLEGRVIGILGSSQRLSVIREWLLPIKVPNGDLYVVGRKGQLVFHRTRIGPEHLSAYARVPAVERLLRGEEGVAQTENPVEHEVRLTAYRQLPSLGWGLVVYRTRDLVLQRTRTLMLAFGAAGLPLAGALAVLGVVAIRNQRRAVGTLQALEEARGELIRKEQLAREARQEAERASQAKSEFLSRMSHELRTPLNAILGFAQLLEMDQLSAEQRESVSHILKGGRHLLELINEVLDISRIEAGRLDVSPEPVLVREVLLEVVDLIRPVADQWNVRLDATTTQGWGRYVLADRQRLKQVLLNLLSNAAKFNRHGGTVAVSVEEVPGDRLRLKVTDTGPGIPPEKIARLFTPFDRLGAEQTRVEGTGLGLALSMRLAELMGGAMGVESVVGEGSTFWVELPQVESPLVEVVLRKGAVVPSEVPVTVGTVLYIEDNLSNLRLVERLLARRPNVKLLSAMQGRLGLELAREHRPSLIFLDLQLPDMLGAEVLQRLQRDPRTAQIPVVVISADATPGQIQRLLTAGAREFLTKPLDVKKLMTLLDETLNRRGG